MNLTTPMFEILAALAAGPLHGYGISKRIVELHDNTVRPMGPATLYSSIQKLEEMGLLEQASTQGEDPRRKTYRITNSGKGVLAKHAARQRSFLDTAIPSNLLPEGM